MRKAYKLRMLPGLYERMRRAAASEQLCISDIVERFAASLPPLE